MMLQYLVEKAASYEPYLRPGVVLEVRWSRHHGYVEWIGPTKMSSFIREWGRFMEIRRRDLFLHCFDPWLGVVHDDGVTIIPLNIESLKKNQC
jgi:hypothetical protein